LSKYLRYGIIEDLDTVRHIPLGRFWGTQVSITPWLWLGLPVFFALGLALNIFQPGASLAGAAYAAGVFVLAVGISTLLHALGHVVGGKIVRGPMDELLLTATRGVNLYFGDQNAVPGYVHLGRALGGPLLNLLVAALLARVQAVGGQGWGAALVAGVGSTSLFIGAGALLPLPSVDGEVIWREVGRYLSARRRA
jgi:hypothetical protein